MDATLIKALQLVLSLSILVVLHEGGHFFFSKLFRVKVEKFFSFFSILISTYLVRKTNGLPVCFPSARTMRPSTVSVGFPLEAM